MSDNEMVEIPFENQSDQAILLLAAVEELGEDPASVETRTDGGGAFRVPLAVAEQAFGDRLEPRPLQEVTPVVVTQETDELVKAAQEATVTPSAPESPVPSTEEAAVAADAVVEDKPVAKKAPAKRTTTKKAAAKKTAATKK